MVKTNLLATILLVTSLLVGCSNGTNAAQTAINETAKVLVAADMAFAPRYEQAAIAARDSSETWGERDEQMKAWDQAANAIIASYRWLVAAESFIDTWDDCKGSSQCDLAQAVSCLAATLGQTQTMLRSLGVQLPTQTDKVLEVLSKIGPHQCEVQYAF